ncbi:hypothetical protein [Actinomadura sp. 6N118]|uniref:hypothetical protein n=1 Tax=Actinomadura sp. 6N118 TaxID=3375151 RepID=UPI0037AF932A
MRSVDVLAIAAPAIIGARAIVFGIMLKRGQGRARVTRREHVDYDKLPPNIRGQVSRLSIVLGLAFLAFSAIGMVDPGPILLVPVGVMIYFAYPYYRQAKQLKDAAKQITLNERSG